MNWSLIVAGAIALVGSGIHGIVGDGLVRRLDPGAVQPSARFLIRVTWHFVTIAFLVLGAALVTVGVRPHLGAAIGVAYGAGALFTCWAVLVVVGGAIRNGPRGWLSHPAPVMLTLTAALIWIGLAQL